MKLVHWDDDLVPPVERVRISDGNILIKDNKFLWNLQVGDQIQYRTELNTECYFVTGVEPDGENLGMNLVAIEMVS